jgi:tetratricopeptide (TPR) repeat protein
VAGDWFRDSSWTPDAQEEFERRLSAARVRSRAQYLRVKALALLAAKHPEAGQAMLHRILDEYPENWLECAFALERLGDLSRAAGDLGGAEAFYRKCLATSPTQSGTTGMVEVSLAEVLTDYDDPGSREEAAALLQSALERGSFFNSNLFRWHVALIRLASQLGDEETQGRSARAALALADLGPQLPRHPTIGNVDVDPETRRWLEDLVG